MLILFRRFFEKSIFRNLPKEKRRASVGGPAAAAAGRGRGPRLSVHGFPLRWRLVSFLVALGWFGAGGLLYPASTWLGNSLASGKPNAS